MTSDDFIVRLMTPEDRLAVVDVGRGLPQWFTANGVANMTIDVANHRGAVAERGGSVVGFATWFSYQGIGHVGWMGVRAEHHREGVGRRLLAVLEDHVRASGASELRVETLGDSVDYEPYARTRAFYRALGFADFRREVTDDPECPEQLTLSKRLVPQ